MSNDTNPIITESKKIEPEFIELIHQRFGLVTHVNQASELTKTISTTCIKLNYTPREYLMRLKNSAYNAPLLADLLAAITVGESYFFRDKNQMILLEKTLLPRLIKHKADERSLKIWSAGCSSGEEIYTLVMLLTQLLPNMDQWDLCFVGTDINTAALQKARSGIYGQWSMRSIAEKYIQRYFKKEQRAYILSPEICHRVQFKYLNLCENSYPSIINGLFDVDFILCRNVLIYFDNELVTRIMSKLSGCIAAHGYLILGASDPIETSGTNFVFHHREAIYFSLTPDDEANRD